VLITPAAMHNSYILRNTSTCLVYKFQVLDDTSTRLICLKSNINPTLVFTLETRYPHNIGIYIPTVFQPKIRLGTLFIYLFISGGIFFPFSRNYFEKNNLVINSALFWKKIPQKENFIKKSIKSHHNCLKYERMLKIFYFHIWTLPNLANVRLD
jgi:hypothetical protein